MEIWACRIHCARTLVESVVTDSGWVKGMNRMRGRACRRGHRDTMYAVTLDVFGLVRRRGSRALRTDTRRHIEKVVPHPVLNVWVV